MKTIKKTLAIVLTAFMLLSTCGTAAFAYEGFYENPLPKSGAGLEEGAVYFDVEALISSPGMDPVIAGIYRSGSYYLSLDGNTIRFVTREGDYTDYERSNPEFGVFFADLLVAPSGTPYDPAASGDDPGTEPDLTGFTALPTADSGELADGAYYLDLEDFLAAIRADAELTAQLRGYAFYLSDDGETIRLVAGSEITDLTEETQPDLFVFLRRHNAAAAWTLLPFANGDELADGDYWFDLEGVLQLERVDAETAAGIIGASAFYLNADADRIVAFVDGDVDSYAGDSDPVIFAFLHQHGYAPDREGFAPVVKEAADVTDGCWYFDLEGFLDAAVAEENENRILDGTPAMTAEEEASKRAGMTDMISGLTLFYHPTNKTLVVPFGSTDVILTDDVPMVNAYSLTLPQIYKVFTADLPAACDADGYTGALAIEKDGETVILIAGEEVPASHTYGEDDWTDGVFADCGNDGSIGYFTCTVCGKRFDTEGNLLTDDDIVIPATGLHDWIWVTDEDAGCYTPGVQHQYCTVCEQTQAEGTPIPAAHSFEPMVEAAAPGCVSDGNVAYYHCTVCGDDFDADGNKLESVILPAAGHVYGDPVWSWTDDFAATATFTCEKGDDTQTPDVTVTDKVAVAPTATAAGTKVYTATVVFDGKTYTDTKEETLPAAGEPETPTEHEQPTEPDAPAGNDNICKWDNQDHGTSFFGKLIRFFHDILYFFAHLFGKR